MFARLEEQLLPNVINIAYMYVYVCDRGLVNDVDQFDLFIYFFLCFFLSLKKKMQVREISRDDFLFPDTLAHSQHEKI